jgi:hypothetical protein
LGFGQVDWIGNYRQGIKAEAELAGGYTFYPPAYYRPPPVPPPPPEASPALPPRSRWNNTFSVDVLGYLALTPYFGISGRIRLRNWFNDPYREGGDDLRGLLNRHLQARAILSLNLDFPFRVLRVYPSEWFQNGKLRFFDFELHGSPFVDLALAAGETGNPRGSLRETSFSPGDLYWTGGLELILFPAFMRSIYLRVSLGYNFRELIRTGEVSPWDELFIGFGHQY